jgi:hypothetical protein
VTPVSMVAYWMMILWLKEGDTCVYGGLLNDDILIKTKWVLTVISLNIKVIDRLSTEKYE